MGKSELYDAAALLEAETEKAWLLNFGDQTHWIPKSQAEYDKDSKTVTMPDWLAEKIGIV